MSFIQQIKKNTTFTGKVFIPSFIFIVVIALFCIIVPDTAKSTLNHLKSYAFDTFSWFYILSVSIFIAFLLLLAMSSLGNIRLGADDEEAEFPFLSWIAMLFAAGMGVGLMYFGVAEPLLHSVADITKSNPEEKAMLFTFFHWGIHPWAIYGTISLALAYFGFRYRLPLSLRSTFYPLLKDKIKGPIGDVIDALALIATIFGLVTTLGYGAMQLNAGFQELGWLKQTTFSTQAIIIVVVIAIAVLSAISGVGKGVRRLSEINLGMAFLLMVFILLTGSTLYLVGAFSDNIGYYLSNVVHLSFKTYVYDDTHKSWFSGWTVLYWAWWFSWAPFVGLFIARISRGRTIREFIFGVLIIPTLFNLLWFTIFGNSALQVDALTHGALSALTSKPEHLLFAFLHHFPLSSVSSFVAILVLSLFFITSADSGIFVLNSIASAGKIKDMPKWQSALWGAIMVILAVSLLHSGGLDAVQAMTLVVALPFAVIMLIMCFSLLRGLQIDQQYHNEKLNQSSVFWTGKNWKARLGQIMKQSQRSDAESYIKETARPAFETIAKELCERYSTQAKVTEYQDENDNLALEFSIEKGQLRNFVYGIRIESRDTSEDLLKNKHMPHVNQSQVFEPMTYFGDGRIGYDVQYMNQEELIADILKQYDRYLVLLNNEEHHLMTHAPLSEH